MMLYRPPSHARRRRRQMRLARTVAVATLFVVLIVVLLSRSGGKARTGAPNVRTTVPIAPSTTRRPTPVPTHVTTGFMPTELPTAISRSSLVLDGSSVLIFGGLTSAGSSSKALRFDPSTGAVTTDGSLAAALHDAAAAVTRGGAHR